MSVVFFNYSAAQISINVPKNKYGLCVISDTSCYNKTIAADSCKRMVALKCFISPLIVDWKYATKNNFTHEILYHHPQALVRLPVAIALQKIEKDLKEKGLGLKFYDTYRPYSITEKMWKIIPDERYAANPAKGSGHNKGIAVDVSLIDLKNNAELPMPTGFDDFSAKAHNDYMQLDSIVIYNRSFLKNIMEKYGFTALETEWWHYYFKSAEDAELLDIDFNLFNNNCF